MLLMQLIYHHQHKLLNVRSGKEAVSDTNTHDMKQHYITGSGKSNTPDGSRCLSQLLSQLRSAAGQRVLSISDSTSHR